MPLESVTYVGDLVPANPTSADPKSAGDNHIRNLKTALTACFAGFTGAILVTGVDGGTFNAYTLTPANPLPAYSNKMIAVFAPNSLQTGATTLNISGLGAKAVKSVSGSTLAPGELVVGSIYAAFYNGNEFRLLSPTKNYIDQLAFSSSLPAQTLGVLLSNGSSAGFSQTTTGFALNAVKGANIASTAFLNLTTATGEFVHITGTNTISSITIPVGAERVVVFDGALQIVNSAALVCPGGADIFTAAGDVAVVRGDTAGARIVGYTRASGKALAESTIGNHEVSVYTGFGFGSTNTFIRRFTTILTAVGTAITYADSATDGGSFTINEAGLYEIYYSDQTNVTCAFGVSVNSSQLTTNIRTITTANRASVTEAGTTTGGGIGSCTRTLRLAVGDVLRAHWQSNLIAGVAPNVDSILTHFSVRKIAL